MSCLYSYYLFSCLCLAVSILHPPIMYPILLCTILSTLVNLLLLQSSLFSTVLCHTQILRYLYFYPIYSRWWIYSLNRKLAFPVSVMICLICSSVYHFICWWVWLSVCSPAAHCRDWCTVDHGLYHSWS